MLWFALLSSTGDCPLRATSKCYFSNIFAGCETTWEGKATRKSVGVLPWCLQVWSETGCASCSAPWQHPSSLIWASAVVSTCVHVHPTAGALTVVLDGDVWAWADTATPAYAHFASWTSFIGTNAHLVRKVKMDFCGPTVQTQLGWAQWSGARAEPPARAWGGQREGGTWQRNQPREGVKRFVWSFVYLSCQGALQCSWRQRKIFKVVWGHLTAPLLSVFAETGTFRCRLSSETAAPWLKDVVLRHWCDGSWFAVPAQWSWGPEVCWGGRSRCCLLRPL